MPLAPLAPPLGPGAGGGGRTCTMPGVDMGSGGGEGGSEGGGEPIGMRGIEWLVGSCSAARMAAPSSVAGGGGGLRWAGDTGGRVRLSCSAWRTTSWSCRTRIWLSSSSTRESSPAPRTLAALVPLLGLSSPRSLRFARVGLAPLEGKLSARGSGIAHGSPASSSTAMATHGGLSLARRARKSERMASSRSSKMALLTARRKRSSRERRCPLTSSSWLA